MIRGRVIENIPTIPSLVENDKERRFDSIIDFQRHNITLDLTKIYVSAVNQGSRFFCGLKT